ncbi:MAG: efflux RND transporter permease subunit [Planctomycetota bacterium]
MTRFAIGHRVFVMTLAAMAMLFGALTFQEISRREDPELTIRTAIVTCVWPGAPALKVDELVVDVLEEAIAEVDEVDEIRSESQSGVAVIKVELDKRLTEIDQVWDELRNEIRGVQRELPDGALPPVVNSNFGDVSAMVVALHQTPPPGSSTGTIRRRYTDRELEVLAELVEDELETIPSVSGVDLYGLAEERVYLEVSADEWAKLGVGPLELRAALDERNIVESSGELETDGGRFLVRASGEIEVFGGFESIVLGTDAGGHPVLLRDLPFTLRRGIEDPVSERVRFLAPSVRAPHAALLAVEMKKGANVVEMGERVRERLETLRATQLPPDVDFAVVNDLPRQVDGLVGSFVTNLWQAIAVVLLVAFVMMGWRPAVIMAAAVPFCMIAALGVVRQFGVELEQFSIASLIIALGMIVDNAIVVSDQTATLIRGGETRFRAAWRGASELAVPILTSTLTTVAAFLPLLTIPGGTGEYIRSLPIVVSTTLLASYLVAMTVTPVLCFWILRGGHAEAQRESIFERAYSRTIRFCLRAKLFTLTGAFVAVMASVALVPIIGNQFFPGGVRDQLFIEVRLPFGSTVDQTAAVVARIEDVLVETSEAEIDGVPRTRLENAYAIIGSGGPRLMLNMDPEDPSPRYAFMVVNTTDATLSADWVPELRERLSLVPGARIEVSKYALGPPIDQPVEFRISGPDPDVLRVAGDSMVEALRGANGVLDPYHDWGNSTYQVRVDIDPQKVQIAGLNNRQIARSLNALLSGFPLTELREGDYTVPVELRLLESERRALETLEGFYVGSDTTKVPLDSVASLETSWQPASISRFNRRRAITVGSQVDDGYLATAVSASAMPAMQAVLEDLPVEYELDELGEAKETKESQGDMGGALVLSMALILLVLIGQYNSLSKPLVVLSSVPLALIGALVGLWATGWPLGFMPMLGIVSLSGVVINNAIILIDFIENEVAGGTDLELAVERAGRARMRPIVLTTLTTIGGMVPLALFGGPMWAGMSYAMIFGLAFSTALTLLVVPTTYVAFVQWFGMSVTSEESR